MSVNRRRQIMVMFLSLMLLVQVYAQQAKLEKPTTIAYIDRIALIVNKAILTEREVQAYGHILQLSLSNNQQHLGDKQAFRQQLISWLIERMLLLEQSKAMGIIRLKDHVASRLLPFFNRQFNLTDEQVKVLLAKMKWDRKRLIRHMAEEYALDQTQKMYAKGHVHLSEAAVQRALFKANDPAKSFMITDHWVAFSQNVIQARVDQARQELLRFSQGESISDDSTIKSDDWGWMTLNDVPQAFVKSLREHGKKQGFMSPIRTSNGLHMLQIKQTRFGTLVTDKQVRAQLMSNARGKAIFQWLEKLKKHAWIEIK